MEKRVPTKTIWEAVGSWFPALRVRFFARALRTLTSHDSGLTWLWRCNGCLVQKPKPDVFSNPRPMVLVGTRFCSYGSQFVHAEFVFPLVVNLDRLTVIFLFSLSGFRVSKSGFTCPRVQAETCETSM